MTTPFPFVAAQVLTASELNSITNLPSSTKTANYVLTIANVGSRVVMNAAGSTTITVNTSIFSAGDIVELSNIGAGVCTVTAGTATVSSAGPLAIPQYGGGRLVFTSASAAIYFPSAVTVAAPASSGLTWIVSQTLSGASTTFSNVFSATYDNYLITINNFSLTSGGGSAVNMRIGGETSNYSVGQWYGEYNSAGINGLEFGSASTSSWRIGSPAGTGIDELSCTQIMLYNPFKTRRTVFQNMNTNAIATLQIGTGTQSSQSSFTAFTILCAASTFNDGLVNVYGYALS